MDEKTVKQEIKNLVEKFERVKEEEKYKKYNEEQTKKNFILPLFRALGWDVESDDVKAEEKVSKKRVDYAVRDIYIQAVFIQGFSVGDTCYLIGWLPRNEIAVDGNLVRLPNHPYHVDYHIEPLRNTNPLGDLEVV